MSTLHALTSRLTADSLAGGQDNLPLALFFIPWNMFERCFSARDVERLEGVYRCVFPEQGVTPEDLGALWDRYAPQATVVVTGWDTPDISDAMLAQAVNLKGLIHSAGSIKKLVPPSIWDRQILVGTANDALGRGVAETSLGFIISGLKGFFPCSQMTRNKQWQGELPATGYGRVREVFEVTIGIISASKVGRHLLRLLNQFEADVLLYDPTISAEEASELGARQVSLEELMSQSDVVTLHAPALPQLAGLLGAKEFALMKDDAIFINTARGMLVNEQAMLEELQRGRISAILDVTNPEPPALDHPFRSMPNVVLTPHIAGAISTGCKRQGRSAVKHLFEIHEGQELHGGVTRERFAVMA